MSAQLIIEYLAILGGHKKKDILLNSKENLFKL